MKKHPSHLRYYDYGQGVCGERTLRNLPITLHMVRFVFRCTFRIVCTTNKPVDGKTLRYFAGVCPPPYPHSEPVTHP